MLYLGVSNTHEAQLNILRALTRKFRLHPDVNLSILANQCPFNYTGADFYALCSDAMLKAMSRKAQELETKIGMILIVCFITFKYEFYSTADLNARQDTSICPYAVTTNYYLAEMATLQDLVVLVSGADFQSAIQNLVPSISQSDLDHYKKIQSQFSYEIFENSK
jgi:peroxin-6